jgi:hypothetical protein
MPDVRRREFIGLLGGAVAWPLATRVQQANQLVGVLHGGAAALATVASAYRINTHQVFNVAAEDLASRSGQGLCDSPCKELHARALNRY